MNEQSRPPERARIDIEPLKTQLIFITSQLVASSGVYLNVFQELILTTEDKVRLCLIEHLKQLERKRGWIAPLSILIAITLALATVSFKKTFGLSADTWHALFIFSDLLSLGWFIHSIVRVWNSRKIGIDYIVSEFKKESLKQQI
jgi:hypothetical protein